MAELFHECGIAAVYHLPGQGLSRLAVAPPPSDKDPKPARVPEATSSHIPRLLIEMQNRGQLAAGMTRFNSTSRNLLETFKDVGTVTEVFHLNQQKQYHDTMRPLQGMAAIGHVRYATYGGEDKCNAQPFDRLHIEKRKWFSMAFNGQIANVEQLREEILANDDFHFTRDTDTEVLMHLFAQQLSGKTQVSLIDMLRNVSNQLDGAYNIVFLNAMGELVVARDPLGFHPLCYAIDGPMFAAASESVALANMGFREEDIRSLAPGEAAIIQDGRLTIERFAPSQRKSHCFFEWIYFANVASTLDERSVYLVRKRLGEELKRALDLEIVPGDDTIVVPVPDTAKAAADSLAFELKVPCLEGLIRNRYVGRTFIEGTNRADKVRMKYTPLAEVLENKRVILVEDTIVRSTTMQSLISQLRERGRVREIHVRVACPPIVAPCFYGIDMSSVNELFAPQFLKPGQVLTPEIQDQMAKVLGADSLRYLPLDAIARSVDLSSDALCRACLCGEYPTSAGQRRYQIDLAKVPRPSGAAAAISAAATGTTPVTTAQSHTAQPFAAPSLVDQPLATTVQ